MIADLPKYNQPYVNALQLAGIFVRLEFMIAMSTIKIYHLETETWSFRRAFWYTALGMPALAVLATFLCAAVKYIIQG
jgi:hypothetical protein